MNLNENELTIEKKHLDKTIKIIRNKISDLGQVLYDDESKVLEFKKYIWDARTEMDPTEMRSMMSNNDLEISKMMRKGNYLQKLYKIQGSPYFGSIIFEDNDEINNIYIGITHVEDNLEYYVHDWRSPICSLFYDFEVGDAYYKSPLGIIKGKLNRKRQYKIEYGKIKHIFDNNLNIDDELLQEVLSTTTSDKMKNIVNTIQQEQNLVIRDTDNNNLIVQGIAGSGKTSVALHRIAFLLYKIENITSNNILIFSPNSIFSEYISNVLPELGEDNTLQTTFNDFLHKYIKEFKKVESFTTFIERYYKYNETNIKLVRYKQSDSIINDIDAYAKKIISNTLFTKDIELDRVYDYTKEELNEMLTYKYNRFPLFERIEEIAIKLSEINFNSNKSKAKSILKILKESLNIKQDYKKTYMDFFRSEYCKFSLSEREINSFCNKDILNYEDACLFVYLKCLLGGYPKDTLIKQVVVDEAQDYTKLQYLIIKNIFKKADYTLLGDINQTINPYYKYDSLNILKDIFDNSTKYIELTKTYRSSEEIIEYTNKILNLEHISAIRRGTDIPVICKKENILKKDLIEDIKELQENSQSIAIITKTDNEVDRIYNLLKEDMDIHKINNGSDKFDRKLIVIPAYIAKGLEFDSVIIYTDILNKYKEEERYLYYVACTRSQHRLIVYNQ